MHPSTSCRSYFQREPTPGAAPQRGLSEAAVLGRDQQWPQAWVGGKGEATPPRCPVALCWWRPSERIKASGRNCGQGRARACPVPGQRSWHRRQQPGRAPTAACARTRGGAGAQRLGRLLSPRQLRGEGGAATPRGFVQRRAPPRRPRRLWRGRGSEPGRDKARSSGGRSCPGPGAGLRRARRRAGGTPGPAVGRSRFRR